jgi:hypothetical protein
MTLQKVPIGAARQPDPATLAAPSLQAFSPEPGAGLQRTRHTRQSLPPPSR